MSNDTQESLGSTRPRLIYPSVLTQMQIERIKKEDEDEHWISGEELFTEGSSDDDDDHRVSRGNKNPEFISSNNTENIIKSNYTGHHDRGLLKWDQAGSGGNRRSQIRNNDKVKIFDSVNKNCREEGPSSSSSSSSSSSDIGKSEAATGYHEELPDEEREISWRPKRDDNNYEKILNIENSSAIVELRELQFEYGDIVNTISELKTALTPLKMETILNSDNSRKLNNSYNCENEINAADAVNGGDIIIEDDGRVLFNDEYLDLWSKAVVDTDKIEKEILNVIKFDSFIDEIDKKVKKAREDTLREQILNREELRKMQSIGAPESGRMAENSARFFKLCDSTKSHSESITVVESDSNIASCRDEEVEESEELESRESRREKLEKKLIKIKKRKQNFMERNRELAHCAMGTLAITDEEKQRLEKLLEDVDDEEFGSGATDRESAASLSTVYSTPYKIDEEADELLKELTEQLSTINSESYRKSAEEARYSREEFLPHKEEMVINSLRNLVESGSKEIYPISEEEVRRLIGEYHAEQEANDLKSCSNVSLTINEAPTIAQKVIRELIKEAKTAMPLFQFKYQTEEIKDEDET